MNINPFKCLDTLLKHITVEDIAKVWPIDPNNAYGNVQEYCANHWHALYGNRELAIYIDGEEEPHTWQVDIYGGQLILVEC